MKSIIRVAGIVLVLSLSILIFLLLVPRLKILMDSNNLLRDHPAAEMLDAVVRIECIKDKANGYRSVGTGVLVNSTGVVVTALHIVKDARQIIIYVKNHGHYKAVLWHVSEAEDLAVLKVDSSDLPTMLLAEPDYVWSDEDVLVLGNWVLGKTVALRGSVFSITGIPVRTVVVSMSQPVWPGHSGSVVINNKGQVFAIITDRSINSQYADNVAFGVPISTIYAVLEASPYSSFIWNEERAEPDRTYGYRMVPVEERRLIRIP